MGGVIASCYRPNSKTGLLTNLACSTRAMLFAAVVLLTWMSF